MKHEKNAYDMYGTVINDIRFSVLIDQQVLSKSEDLLIILAWKCEFSYELGDISLNY